MAEVPVLHAIARGAASALLDIVHAFRRHPYVMTATTASLLGLAIGFPKKAKVALSVLAVGLAGQEELKGIRQIRQGRKAGDAHLYESGLEEIGRGLIGFGYFGGDLAVTRALSEVGSTVAEMSDVVEVANEVPEILEVSASRNHAKRSQPNAPARAATTDERTRRPVNVTGTSDTS
ncbi:MAG: hypothetical protein H6729_16160 [Deltaproteobacteria bacterium]|nr:hypothetical protein [Deltaproteobacteria bacterium]